MITCNTCEYLKECLYDGNVLDATKPYHDKPHYIRGLGAVCRKEEETIYMNEVTFNVKVTMSKRWVNDFYSMLKYMETCGDIGHSSVVGFYADGDGDFRPHFEFDREFEETDGYWDVDKKPEVIFDAG